MSNVVRGHTRTLTLSPGGPIGPGGPGNPGVPYTKGNKQENTVIKFLCEERNLCPSPNVWEKSAGTLRRNRNSVASAEPAREGDASSVNKPRPDCTAPAWSLRPGDGMENGQASALRLNLGSPSEALRGQFCKRTLDKSSKGKVKNNSQSGLEVLALRHRPSFPGDPGASSGKTGLSILQELSEKGRRESFLKSLSLHKSNEAYLWREMNKLFWGLMLTF